MAAKKSQDELAAQRQSAVYISTVNQLRRNEDGKSEEEIDRLALDAVDRNVYGQDAKRDRHGRYIPQGIGAPGRETTNHFASIRRYQGKESWEAAVREIYKRDPKRAEYLGLPKLKEERAA